MDHESYATLGLVHTLNPIASGGSEQLLPRISPVILVGSGNITDTPDFNATRKGFGRILRDEAGKVVQVTLNPEDTEDRLKDSSEVMREPENTQNAREKWVTNLGKQNDGTSRLEKYVTVEALEHISVAAKTMTIARHASQGEIKYLQRLVDKYGNDMEQMARDRKLNADQRTAGELRRALKRAGLLGAGKGTGKEQVYGGEPDAAQ
ncbi:hypothetical protein AX14_002534 [Amanita brunnescens Koide BX004]|nr:hypothetical protein AX14_002534 [Amanita brunnescens Koide BX004]